MDHRLYGKIRNDIVELLQASHRGWLYSVAVRNDVRRNGVGTVLVRQAEQALQALGCGKVNLQVRAANEAIVSFYEGFGYVVEERASLGKRL
jgi:ribosomal protein S18 acetylase RimI-like enzyme